MKKLAMLHVAAAFAPAWRRVLRMWHRAVSSDLGQFTVWQACVRSAGILAVVVCGRTLAQEVDGNPAPLREIGYRRELFVDTWLIERMERAELRMHKPEPREVVIVCDAPWEGNTSAYFTLFRDDDRFRMYYRGSHWDTEKNRSAHIECTCYAESIDGIKWTKPNLGLFEFAGSKANNIIWQGEGSHCFTPFKDANPHCAADARYKALTRLGRTGLLALKSPDGIHWSKMQDAPVITEGAFDSQNLAFWWPAKNGYVDYHRQFRGVRDIMTASSTDFVHWTKPKFLDYGNPNTEHLYTNAIQPYFRAPHLLIGFPTRFQAATQQVEPVFMTSRDGERFQRWSEPLIPITAPQDRDGNRSNYMTWGLLQLPDSPKEVSVYATEAYYAGPGSRVRRFVFRVDGFVSLHASNRQGEMLTRLFTFQGKELELNYRTSTNGWIKVEIQDEDGRPLDGFSLADCPPMRGDHVASPVRWKGEDRLLPGGRPVRLRFLLDDADLFAMKFQ